MSGATVKPSIRRVRNQNGGLSHGWTLTWSSRVTWHPSWRAARDALSTQRCLWHPKGEPRCTQGRAGAKFDFCEAHERVANILRTATITRPAERPTFRRSP